MRAAGGDLANSDSNAIYRGRMRIGELLLRLAWQRPAAGWCYIGPDRRCLGRLACRELGRLPECLLKFGSERACAPPALYALNLGRLLRVVLPVKKGL